MANITKFERQYCAEHNISLEEYKENFSNDEKFTIREQYELKANELKSLMAEQSVNENR